MEPEKSTWLDGISIIFYQKNWQTMRPLVTFTVLNLLHHEGDFSSLYINHFNPKGEETSKYG